MIGMPFTTVVTSEWVCPLTMRSGFCVSAWARSTTSPWHPCRSSQKAPSWASRITTSAAESRRATVTRESTIAAPPSTRRSAT